MGKISTNFVRGEDGKIPANTVPALSIRRKGGRSNGLGFYVCGELKLGENNDFGGIYQRRVTGYNNTGYRDGLPRKTYYVKMRSYAPTNPRTVTQQNNRARMNAAVAAWQDLTDEQKFAYNHRGNKLSRRGYNLFISEWLQTH